MALKLFICEICHKEYGKLSALGVHVKRTHKIELKEYYDNYIDSTKHKCLYCENEAVFQSLAGYRFTCSNKICQEKHKQEMVKRGFIEKYGVSNIFQLKETITKSKETKKRKYGDENYNNKTKREETCIKKYGAKHNWASKELREKGQYKTCQLKYGNKNYNGDRKIAVEKWKVKYPEIQTKYKKTCQGRYNVDHYSKTDEFNKKFADACFEHFGVPHNFMIPEHRQKTEDSIIKAKETYKQTCIEKYGVDNYAKTEMFKERLAKIMLEHYGVDHYSKTDEFKNKIAETCYNKYGAKSYLQSPEYRKHIHEYHAKMYTGINYDGINFRSNDEMTVYKFCQDHNIEVIYEPCGFKYEYLDKEHIYIPDFMINGKFYEVKGPHLWKDGRLYTPYRNGLTDAECEILDLRDIAKTKCIKENGVTMIFSNELNKLNEILK